VVGRNDFNLFVLIGGWEKLFSYLFSLIGGWEMLFYYFLELIGGWENGFLEGGCGHTFMDWVISQQTGEAQETWKS